jgi:hypothetical protein
MKAQGREVGSAFVLVHVNTQHGVTPSSEDKKGGKKKAKKEVCCVAFFKLILICRVRAGGLGKRGLRGALVSGLRNGWLAI